ncbi:MAG: hypothetical protein L3J23_09430 [Flavobacteriaceae bacterium]|nr:hypothetical protein [Flavobacteriaceae bacterium]
MKVFIYLFFYLLLNSCDKQSHLIRNSVEGYVYNINTKKPLDSVEIGFFVDVSNSNLENIFYSTKKGYFKIPKVEIRTHYEGSKTLRMIYNRLLKFKKIGYFIDTISVRDTIYRIDIKKKKIYVDTIFLKPI